MDALGTMESQRSDFLSPVSGLVRTANLLPSKPVPQVVGTQMSAMALSLLFLPNNVVVDVAIVDHHEGDALGNVHDAAAAQGHDHLAAVVAGELRALLGGGGQRVGLGLVEEHAFDARALERGLHVVKQPRCLGALVGTVTAISSDGCNCMFIKDGLSSRIYTKENMRARNDGEKERDRLELAVEHYIADRRHGDAPSDQILRAVGLTPLPSVATARTVSECLKIRGDYRHLVGYANSQIQMAA